MTTLRLALGLAISLAMHGCVQVAPYQRQTLARRDMLLVANPELLAGEQHSQAYREGSTGGGGAQGGGCGCN